MSKVSGETRSAHGCYLLNDIMLKMSGARCAARDCLMLEIMSKGGPEHVYIAWRLDAEHHVVGVQSTSPEHIAEQGLQLLDFGLLTLL